MHLQPRLPTSDLLRTARVCTSDSRRPRQGCPGQRSRKHGTLETRPSRPSSSDEPPKDSGARRGRFLEGVERVDFASQTHKLILDVRNPRPLRLLPQRYCSSTECHAPPRVLPGRHGGREAGVDLACDRGGQQHASSCVSFAPDALNTCSTCFRDSCPRCQRTTVPATQLRCSPFHRLHWLTMHRIAWR